jgi:hypothetical protein
VRDPEPNPEDTGLRPFIAPAIYHQQGRCARRDFEVTGNAYVEVIWNLEGEIALMRSGDYPRGAPIDGVAQRKRREWMPSYLVGTCLMALGLAMMLWGIAWNAKCRDDAMPCCISFHGLGISCR